MRFGVVKSGCSGCTISPRLPVVLLNVSGAGSHAACQLESWICIIASDPPACTKSIRAAGLSLRPA